jgi:predicted permease
MEKNDLLTLIYLYWFSAIGLILVVIGAVKLLDVAMRTFIFSQADFYYFPTPAITITANEKLSQEELQKKIEEQKRIEEANRKSQRQREISRSLAMILVGAPLYFYHWRLILTRIK